MGLLEGAPRLAETPGELRDSAECFRGSLPKVDISKLPSLNASQKTELTTLAKAPNEKIDYSDIPSLSSEFWQVAERGRFHKAVKKSTTVRVDADVLAWLKNQGDGYQTRINAILREAMLRPLSGGRAG